MAEPSQNTGAKLYLHAKERIPGGTQLLSKRPEMFLPDQWPAYYSRCKGCEVWDLDGRRLIDMSTMGIGSCILGYADADVNRAVHEAVERGSMCTLNSPAEVALADLLCELHPWAGQVRYARCGGEAMAVATRIARAWSGRDKVAFCGYHGWHDWYLAANLADDRNLDGHLLAGLEPRGVPRGLAGTVLPFHYNRIDELEAIVARHGGEIGAIIMEPIRWEAPQDGFLHRVRDIARRIGATLVFDEITVGWRLALGGTHLGLGVEPDIAVFAKAMSNGFAMGAVIGASAVMQASQGSFISSTYWTEALGPAAAVAAITKMRTIAAPDRVARAGGLAQEGWRRLAGKHGLRAKVEGRPGLTHFALDYGESSQALLTLLTQCMLDRGYITSGGFYPSCAHTDAVVNDYLAALDEALAEVKAAAERGDVLSRLRGPVAHKGFQRLN
jgi:glutamate-1-semialdehyde 2,1-aminomutase